MQPDTKSAQAAVLFVIQSADLSSTDAQTVIEFARRDGLAWIAYPKAGQLGLI